MNALPVVGRTRVVRIQTDVDYQISKTWKVSGGYLYNQAKVVEFAAVPALANNCQGIAGEACFLPQVPENRGSVRVVYSDAKYATVALGVQTIGRQFEDDQNVFTLRRATVFDVFASRTIARSISAFVAVENLFDSIYDVGRTPVLTTGLPRSARVGVRMFLP